MTLALPDLIGRLVDLTEAEVGAARTLEGADVQRLNQERSDLLFEIRVLLQDPVELSDEDRQAMAVRMDQLRLAEVRLERIASTVLRTLSVLNPKEAPTYARTGDLRG